MSAEPIATVVADLKAGRLRNGLLPTKNGDSKQLFEIARRWAGLGTVVDSTAIYQDLVDRPRPVALYEDHPCISPPFPNGVIAYVNQHGNVVAMSLMAIDWHRPLHPIPDSDKEFTGEDKEAWRKVTEEGMERWDRVNETAGAHRWETAAPTDWDRVRWTIDTFVWVGGRSNTVGPVPTTGPMHMWRFAVYENGEPADLHWVQLAPDKNEMLAWDMAHLVLLGTLNLCNAVNTELVHVPATQRAERRRTERTGVRVHTIHIQPSGRRSTRPGNQTGLIPLHTVRGHFSHYGDCCPGPPRRHEPHALLFGKYEGRFWVPHHARGDKTRGEVIQDYIADPKNLR